MMNTKFVVNRTCLPVRFPTAGILMCYILGSNLETSSTLATAIKWALFGCIVTVLLLIWIVNIGREKHINIFGKDESEENEKQKNKSRILTLFNFD